MEESTTPKVSLAQHAAKWGAIIGGGSIVLTLLIYIVDYTLLADWKMIVLLLVFLGLVIYAGINYRNQIGGFLPYGKAFQHAFITFAVLGIVSTAFTVILYTVIDSELPAKLTEVALENTQKMMENFGVPEDQMDKAMEDAKERSADQFSAFGLVKGYGFALIFYAILSLIGALFVRKNEPVEF
ncbi:MAG: DUF4199 domain-containing protein [Cyclobacteriaceae bacterium]|jgi:hypothetical protein|nr:DUF4199 domain-containing protein [Flammeovirgaceae bacterium]